ncbi:MAG: hypothetical protein ACOH1T_05945 [Microbacteriaceae bacterium]
MMFAAASIATVTTMMWIVASVALVGVVAYAGYRLVRGTVRIFVGLSDLANTTAQLDNVQATRELERPRPAVLLGRKTVVEEFDQRMGRRTRLRDANRNARLARARALVRPERHALPALPSRRR